MFPPFIDSFGDQFSAVMINTIGSIFGGAMNAIISALVGSFVTNLVTPIFQSLAMALGI